MSCWERSAHWSVWRTQHQVGMTAALSSHSRHWGETRERSLLSQDRQVLLLTFYYTTSSIPVSFKCFPSFCPAFKILSRKLEVANANLCFTTPMQTEHRLYPVKLTLLLKCWQFCACQSENWVFVGPSTGRLELKYTYSIHLYTMDVIAEHKHHHNLNIPFFF